MLLLCVCTVALCFETLMDYLGFADIECGYGGIHVYLVCRY